VFLCDRRKESFMNIGVIGYGRTNNRGIAETIDNAIAEEERRQREILLQDMKGNNETSNMEQGSLYEIIKHMCNVGRTAKELSDSFEDIYLTIPQEPTIEQLKKQIKHSKNPLEVKMLNKKLNELYKKKR
jgi:F420-0:gamma-glutamyl ligase-like protein